MERNRESKPIRLGEPGCLERDLGPLYVRVRWPRLEGDGAGASRIDRYYQALADHWRRRWEGPLLDRAKVQPAPEGLPWSAGLDFTVTYWGEDLLSLWWEAAEHTDGRRPRRLRQGDTWRLSEGTPVPLRELLPPSRRWRREAVEQVRQQIGARLEKGESLFYKDWSTLAARQFSPGRAYLTGEGPAVFYPVEAIAPALEGFPTFPLRGREAVFSEEEPPRRQG